MEKDIFNFELIYLEFKILYIWILKKKTKQDFN